MDPVAFVRYLRTFGDLQHIEPVLDHLPEFDALDPEACYLGLEVAFASEAEQAVIEGAFDFVREDGRIRILPPGDSLARYADLLAEQLDEGDAQRQRLLRCGTLREDELARLDAKPVAGRRNRASRQRNDEQRRFERAHRCRQSGQGAHAGLRRSQPYPCRCRQAGPTDQPGGRADPA